MIHTIGREASLRRRRRNFVESSGPNEGVVSPYILLNTTNKATWFGVNYGPTILLCLTSLCSPSQTLSLPVFVFTCLSLCLCVLDIVCLLVYPFMYLRVSFDLSIPLPFDLFLHLSVHTSNYLSISPNIYSLMIKCIFSYIYLS